MFILLTCDTEAGPRQPHRFASHEEADLVWWGSPVPKEAVVFQNTTEILPAIFTRSARLVSDFPVLTVRAGTFLLPSCPFMETGAQCGKDPRRERAVPDALKLWDSGFSIGRLVGRMGNAVVIGESIPGGDVTASLLLRSFNLVDGDSAHGAVWNEVSSRLGIGMGEFSGRGFDAVTELGDPMQIVAAGIASGARDRADVILAGGIPMLAVAALLRNLGDKGRITVATTSRTAEDASSGFRSMVEALKIDTLIIPLDEVPDGAGAGGAAWYAEKLGFPLEQVLRRAGFLCRELSAASPGDPER